MTKQRETCTRSFVWQPPSNTSCSYLSTLAKWYHIFSFLVFSVPVGTMTANVRGLAMVGHLKNISPTFAQLFNRITNIEFTSVRPTIANTMLVAGILVIIEVSILFNYLFIVAFALSTF
jgi:hypothetical protein